MSPDDPRHGEYRGAVAHWFSKEPLCQACELAERRYRRRRQRRILDGDAPTVTSIGTVRRFQALMALGWRGPEIALAAGVSINTLRSVVYHESVTVHAATARGVAEAYERMSMGVPTGQYANRTRALARIRGWLPPLAWDDIDDPDAEPWTETRAPRGVRRERIGDLIEDFDFLVRQGESEEQAATRLGVRLDSFTDQRRRYEKKQEVA